MNGSTFTQDEFKFIPLSVLKPLMQLEQPHHSKFQELGFDDKKRLYIPLNHTSDNVYLDSVIQVEVGDVLRSLNYTLIDYKKGLCKKDGDEKNVYKVGKVLNKNNAEYTLKRFNEDMIRSNVNLNLDELEVVISYNPFDIAMMSTGRGWSSCMRYKIGEFSDFAKHIHDDISCGMLVAYLIHKDDKKIHNPKARMLLKPYKNFNTGETYYIPAGMVYGLTLESFKNTLQEWLDEWQPEKEDVLYVNSYKFYIDKSESNIIFNKEDDVSESEKLQLLSFYNAEPDGNGKYKIKGDISIAGYPLKEFTFPISSIEGNLTIERNRVLENFNFLKGAVIHGDTDISWNRYNFKNFKGLEGVYFKGDFKVLKNSGINTFEGLKDCTFDGEFRFAFNGMFPDFKGTSGCKFNGKFVVDGNHIISYEGIEDFDFSDCIFLSTSIIDNPATPLLSTLPIDLKLKNITTAHYLNLPDAQDVYENSLMYYTQQEITDSEITFQELKFKYKVYPRSDWDRQQIIKRYTGHSKYSQVLEIIGD